MKSINQNRFLGRKEGYSEHMSNFNEQIEGGYYKNHSNPPKGLGDNSMIDYEKNNTGTKF